MAERIKGTVKWFNADKGYGFITQDGSDADVFVHHTAINMQGYRKLEEGDIVEFEITEGRKGPQASEVTVVESAPQQSNDMGYGGYDSDY